MQSNGNKKNISLKKKKKKINFLNRFLVSIFALIVVTIWLVSYESAGALISNAQYSSCDSSRLNLCQQDIIKDVQYAGSNAAGVQQIVSGPPYSPKQQYQQLQQHQNLAISTACRHIRSNLDCLLVTTPACYDQGFQAAQNTDIILRAKRFLEQNNCNEPDTSWQTSLCYRSPTIQACEERYGFTSFSSTSLSWATNNLTICLNYQAFKDCVERYLRFSCKVHEMDMINEYIIDKASDLAWRCRTNSTLYGSANSLYSRPYQLNNSPGSVISPSNYNPADYSGYDQRPVPSYFGSSSGAYNHLNQANRDQWERFRSPQDETRFGISRYPGDGSFNAFDRLVAAGNGFDVDTSDCPAKAAPYARECQDTLQEQQRLSKDSRDGFELQRRICCALFQYRDCVSRVVLDRCADSSPTAVEIIMGVQRREMTITCRNFNRDVCSGATAKGVLNLSLLLTLAILASFITFKQTNLPRF